MNFLVINSYYQHKRMSAYYRLTHKSGSHCSVETSSLARWRSYTMNMFKFLHTVCTCKYFFHPVEKMGSLECDLESFILQNNTYNLRYFFSTIVYLEITK